MIYNNISFQISWDHSFTKLSLNDIVSFVAQLSAYRYTHCAKLSRSWISVTKNFFLCWQDKTCMNTWHKKLQCLLRSFWLEHFVGRPSAILVLLQKRYGTNIRVCVI